MDFCVLGLLKSALSNLPTYKALESFSRGVEQNASSDIIKNIIIVKMTMWNDS